MRQRRSDITGVRLALDVLELLDDEIERTGRYRATILNSLVREHLGVRRPRPEDERNTSSAPVGASSN